MVFIHIYLNLITDFDSLYKTLRMRVQNFLLRHCVFTFRNPLVRIQIPLNVFSACIDIRTSVNE